MSVSSFEAGRRPADVLQEHSFLRPPVVLHTISSFEAGIQEKSAASILRGIALCIKEASPLRNEMTNSPDFWAIIKSLGAVEEAAAMAFGIVEDITTGSSSAITADNYELAISQLDSFASAGSVGATIEQKQDLTARRGKSGKQTKAMYVPLPGGGDVLSYDQRARRGAAWQDGRGNHLQLYWARTESDQAVSAREERR